MAEFKSECQMGLIELPLEYYNLQTNQPAYLHKLRRRVVVMNTTSLNEAAIYLEEGRVSNAS